MKLIRLISALIASLVLAACSGTGVKYDNKIAQEVTNETATIYIARKSAFVGSGVVLKVTVNGQEVGELGSGEILEAKAVSGANVIEVVGTGLSGVGPFGYKDGRYEFAQVGVENRYVAIGLDHSIFAFNHAIEITEQTLGSWKKNASN